MWHQSRMWHHAGRPQSCAISRKRRNKQFFTPGDGQLHGNVRQIRNGRTSWAVELPNPDAGDEETGKSLYQEARDELRLNV